MLAPNRCGTARDCPPGLSPEGRTGRAVSRVLFSRACAREDGHLSGTTVAGRLERPTRGSPLAHARDLVVWVTPRRLFGLAPTGGCRATVRCRRCGGLLPHLFTLTPRSRSGRCLFCGPVRRLAAPRRYLAVYPLELGLSSGRPKAPATTALDPPQKANSPARLGPTPPGGGVPHWAPSTRLADSSWWSPAGFEASTRCIRSSPTDACSTKGRSAGSAVRHCEATRPVAPAVHSRRRDRPRVLRGERSFLAGRRPISFGCDSAAKGCAAGPRGSVEAALRPDC